jgi:ComF family protein
VLLAARCPACGTPGAAPCARCATELRRAPSLAVPPGLDALYALLAYDGVGRELVARLKYRNARAVAGRLAASMAGLVAGIATAFDVVTWAPTSVERRRARGFDQAELLARRIARELGLPAPALLRRANGPPQTGRHAAERHLGPSFAFAATPRLRSRHAVVPASVLLVDDVVTTGATLTSAARALRQAGVTTVVGLAAARTPLKARRVASDTRK